MNIPQYGGPDDVRTLVNYLKSKPAGATLKEAKQTLEPSTLDGRKLSALEYWGFIQRDGDRLKLSPLGRELGRAPESEQQIFRRVVSDVRPYRQALERAHFQAFPSLDAHELGSYWHENFSEDLGTDSEKSISTACATFFKLAEAAGLGSYVLGRRGAPTRLDLNRSNLGSLIEGGPTESPAEPEHDVDDVRQPEAEEADAVAGSSAPRGDEQREEPDDEAPKPLSGEEDTSKPRSTRIFIAHGKNHAIVQQVADLLEFADIPYEIAEEEETTAIPVPEKVLGAMRRCTAGIIIVSVDDESAEDFRVNENVLIEAGAAFVQYDQQVVLLWDRRIDVPSNLEGLYRCEFEGSTLSWEAGRKLMQTIKGFRSSSDA